MTPLETTTSKPAFRGGLVVVRLAVRAEFEDWY